MRRARHWLALVVALATLTAFVPFRPAAAQVLDPIQYALFKPADFGYGCDGPCDCPWVTTGPLSGTFTFYRTSVDPLYAHYALLNIVWRYPVPGTGAFATITGHGTYDIGGEVANLQRMQLDVVTDGALAQHFDSGLVPHARDLPRHRHRGHAPMNVCATVPPRHRGPQGTRSGAAERVPAMRLTASPNPTAAGDRRGADAAHGRSGARGLGAERAGQMRRAARDTARFPQARALHWERPNRERLRRRRAGVFSVCAR
jgi:hypothetical protein